MLSRFTSLALVSVLATSVSAFGAAQVFFDIDGPGSATSNQLSPNGLLDFLEGNAVITGAKPILSGVLPPIGTTFQAYFQAQMAAVVFNDGSIDSPFFRPPQEITMQVAIPMVFTGVSGGRAQIALAGTGVNSFDLYFDPTRDSNIISGLGFGGGGDSQLILSAAFNFLDFSIPLTLAGQSTLLSYATVTYTDPAFFQISPAMQIVLALDLDGLVKVPPQIPPSQQIVGYVPQGNDLLASIDSTVSLTPIEVIPVPASGLLLGIGLIGLAAGKQLLRRRETTSVEA